MIDARSSQPTTGDQAPPVEAVVDVAAGNGMGEARGVAVISEILVEEVSIDGMCGVY
jgi:mycofactocin precursor